MMSAGALTAAPARAGATRPTAAVTPMSRPVAWARRRPDRGRRPGGGPPEAGSSRRSRDGAIRDAGVVRDTEDFLPWRMAGRAADTGRPCAMGLGGPAMTAVVGDGADCGLRHVRRETGLWSRSVRDDGARVGCVKPRSACKTPYFLPVRRRSRFASGVAVL